MGNYNARTTIFTTVTSIIYIMGVLIEGFHWRLMHIPVFTPGTGYEQVG